MTTSIEWTNETWNPITGCSKVSEGCRNCYAEAVDRRFAQRLYGTEHKPWTAGNAAHNVRLHVDRLDQPLKWKKPKLIFVNSMSDLFHSEVEFDFIKAVWARMQAAHWHTFQVLTKRPERMLEFFKWMEQQEVRVETVLPNVWIGVSVEDQKTANERIPLLMQTPAAVRFLSCEPLLGPVSIFCADDTIGMEGSGPGFPREPQLHWVIAGGESGSNARPMHPEWVRGLRNQCQTANIPFFFKQWGAWVPSTGDNVFANCQGAWVVLSASGEILGSGTARNCGRCAGNWKERGGVWMEKVGKDRAGRLLDGREWNEMPLH